MGNPDGFAESYIFNPLRLFALDSAFYLPKEFLDRASTAPIAKASRGCLVSSALGQNSQWAGRVWLSLEGDGFFGRFRKKLHL